MKKIKFILFLLIICVSCDAQKLNIKAEAQLLALSKQKPIIYLLNDKIYNLQNQAIAHYKGDTLYNLQNQAIAYLENEKIYHINRQLLGKVQNHDLLSDKGEIIANIEGNNLKNCVKVSAYYFFIYP